MADMEVDTGGPGFPTPEHDPFSRAEDHLEPAGAENVPIPMPMPPTRDHFKDVMVKVHTRRPDKDNWTYVGRAVVKVVKDGHAHRVVVRSQSNDRNIVVFHEGADIMTEKRGNFVVIGMVDGNRVTSWSLNALNNSETLRLLASIDLAVYKSSQSLGGHAKGRRKVERLIKDDRRKRHRRRREQESMLEAFARQNISDSLAEQVD